MLFGVCLCVFPDEISIWIDTISKADWSPHCDWGSFNPSRPWRQQNAEGKICPFLLDCSSWNISLLLLVLLVLRPSDQGKNQFPWFSGLWTWTDLYHQLSCLCLVDGWLWDLSDSIITWTIATLTNLYTYLSLSIYVCHLLNLFLWITLANINTWGIQLLVVRSL